MLIGGGRQENELFVFHMRLEHSINNFLVNKEDLYM